MDFRIAKSPDFKQLAELRWQFRTETDEEKILIEKEEFIDRCAAYFEEKSKSGYHTYWIAVDGDVIVAQVFVHLIDLIPRPCKFEDSFGYMTNNYTRPEYRNRGIGAQLMERVAEWAKAEDMELLLVYPSQRAVPFYERAGFTSGSEVLELKLREYYDEAWTDAG